MSQGERQSLLAPERTEERPSTPSSSLLSLSSSLSKTRQQYRPISRLLRIVVGCVIVAFVASSFVLLFPLIKDHPSSNVEAAGLLSPNPFSWMGLFRSDGKEGDPTATWARVHDQPGFWGYSPPPPPVDDGKEESRFHNVSYDHRAIQINEQPVLLLGGSLHPVRHTPATWAAALDEAVAIGFNLVTIYVMWSAHQPFPDDPLDWRLPGSSLVCSSSATSSSSRSTSFSNNNNNQNCWTLATAIQQAARRRLWVHLRIGPYVCAEYNYGGLPEWVALQNQSHMSLRRPNRPWLDAMETFVQNVTQYMSSHSLWAHQGGNILLGQIENELQGDIDLAKENIMWVSPDGELVDSEMEGGRRANLQDYANWCGKLVQRLEPQVVWTMCQGLSAPNTIETFNGVDGSVWIDHDGGSKRVQQDYPAMWTELEGGFQIWGDDAPDPSDYFWGQTARQYAFRALRWIARGGTHLNYYMFAGGYNRDRMAAAGIMNMYASDAPLCPSGERRQPKFDHLQRLHGLLRNYASSLLSSRAYPEFILVLDEQSETWVSSSNETLLFRYQHEDSTVVFIENTLGVSIWVRWNASSEETVTAQLSPWSVSVYDGSDLQMDSSQLEPKAKAYRRFSRRIYLPPAYDTKRIPLPSKCKEGFVDAKPIEQTQLMTQSRTWSDYAWYSTEWGQSIALNAPILAIETQLSNAFIVFLDGRRVASNDTHPHKEDSVTLTFTLPPLQPGRHRLTLLSESLGYDNVIGVWGASTEAKTKGITGDVYLQTPLSNQSLLEGQEWCSCAGLLTCQHSLDTSVDEDTAVFRTVYHFWTPRINDGERLFVRIREGRGHLKLNGSDLGRFWNITRTHSGRYSQTNYFLPTDYLRDGENNELILDNVFGDPIENIQLGVSHIAPGMVNSGMEDLIDFPWACL
eukprot:scaffold20312_cov185-Amphora_coffeaeformis.AAC.3